MRESDLQDKQKYLISEFLSIVVSALLVCLTAFLIYNKFHYLDNVDMNIIKNNFVVSIKSFKPENVEKVQFFSGLVVSCSLIYIFNTIILKMLDKKKRINLTRLYDIISVIIVSSVCFIFLSDIVNNDFYIKYNFFYNYQTQTILILTAIGMAAIFYYKLIKYFEKSIKYLPVSADIISIFLISSLSHMQILSIYSVDNTGVFQSHFNAYFYSVAQVYQGKALLVDFVNQYGLYPHFLEPIFRITGLDVLKFTTLMAILFGISLLNIYLFIKNIVKNRLIALSGFIMILFFNFLYLKNVSTDPYFQFYPHRLIFPTLLLVLSLLYFEKKYNSLYYLSFILYSIAILWNPDMGIVVFGTWILALIYSDFLQYDSRPTLTKATRHLANGFAIFLLVFSVYNMYIYMRYGSFPNFYGFTEYLTLFGGLGFFMLPMKLVHPWNLVILIYIVGISHSARYIIEKENTLRSRMIFLLSILGAGIFVYYQGRSHDWNLLHIWYPALILLTICADDLFFKIKGSVRSKNLDFMELSIFALIILLIISSNLSFLSTYNVVQDVTKIRQDAIKSGNSTDITKGVEFIKENTFPGEKVLILSFNTGIYHVGSLTTAPLSIPGFSELFLKEDYDKILNFLKGNSAYSNKVFLDISFLRYTSLMDVVPIHKALLDNYRMVTRSDGGSIILLQKDHNISNNLSISNRKEFLLPYSNNTLFHYTNDNYDTDWVGGITPATLELDDNFTLELIIKPSENQAPLACIVGNHPGYNNDEGFVVERDYTNNNTYFFTFGNGEDWSPYLRFDLSAEKWNYLAIVVSKDKIEIYNNGLKLISAEKKDSMANSQMPLFIGNWQKGNRQFNGTIKEIRISNNSMIRDDIIRNCLSISSMIKQ